MPLDVAPPRGTRFGSPPVLSRMHWVRPQLAEVKFLAWTEDNLLRQVVYEGLREDKPAASASITVLSVTPMRTGKLFALAAVEVDIEGIPFEIHGIRAMNVPPAATRIALPTYRDAAGRSRAAIVLPEAVRRPIGDAVLDRLVDLGLAVRRSRQAA
jgi:hypothetical protein